jgi:hypothetical protein
MSANLTRQIALAAAAAVAAVTAVLVQVLSGSLVSALVALAGALVAGGVALLLPGRVAGPAPTPAPAVDTDGTDRATLIGLSLYLRDRLTSAALAERVDRELAAVGVLPVEPVGERFDPSVHAAEGAVPTADSQLVGTIAAVEAPGYADRGVLLRPATVTVYQPAPADVTGPAAS